MNTKTLWIAAAAALALACADRRTTVVCPVGAAYCGGSCSSLATDASNCGACGHACDAGQACLAGACTAEVATCTGGLTACGGACVAVATDRSNCGTCGHVCGIHEACTGGGCALQCQADLVLCGSACVDVATDAANCGTCGHACAAGVACTAGACGGGGGGGPPTCATGLVSCGGACVDNLTNASHCGTCGHACAAGVPCVAGACTPNCGAQTACGESCFDLQNDFRNCGACGRACVNGEACTAGACACADGSVACEAGGPCLHLASDAHNCGTCGNACPAGDTCVAGVCAPDAAAFRMLGGDAGHSGLNPGETGTPPLTQAWIAYGVANRGPVVIEGGRVFSIGGSYLHALEAESGAELWSYNFGSIWGGIGWPAVSGGKVYVATSNNYNDTWLREFDRGTGEVGFKVPFGSQWEQYWSPIVVDGVVYTNGGTYGGLYGFDASALGTQLFFADLEQYDEWSPAWFGGAVYTFVEGKVRAHDPATGEILRTLDVGWSWAGWSAMTAPVFDGTRGYVISPPNLVAFDPATLEKAWTVNSSYVAYPAAADGLVFALSSGNLHALDAATGARKWLFSGDDKLAYPPVIANGYVYVASASNVYAVDLSTHKQVWTAPFGGRLAIGAGFLFVSRESAGELVAFRLTR